MSDETEFRLTLKGQIAVELMPDLRTDAPNADAIYRKVEAMLSSATARAERLEARVKELEAAIAPFASAYDVDDLPDDSAVSIVGEITMLDALLVGDFRRAASALSAKGAR